MTRIDVGPRYIELLEPTMCPRGCGAEVLVGSDETVFDSRPRWVLEHPFGEGFGLRTAIIRSTPGVVQLVRRAQLWYEHECAPKRSPDVGMFASEARDPAPVEAPSAADTRNRRRRARRSSRTASRG